jgi:hypothetical protein
LYRVDAGVPAAIFTATNGRLTALLDPINPQEACTKNYADTVITRQWAGYIPQMKSSPLTLDSLKTGFIATASSTFSTSYVPSNVFNSLYVSGAGVNGEWETAGVTTNFWIQIQCPEAVRLWKVAFRGRDTGPRIFNWQFQGSNDGIAYTALVSPPNPTYIDTTMLQFSITTAVFYSYYRLFAFQAEAPNPGLSYMQIYVYAS